MNLLQKITVTGEIRLSHALLSLQYTFVNTGAAPLSPRYLFPLPAEGMISGFQLLAPGRKLLRAAVVPRSGGLTQVSGARLVQLEPQLYCLEWESLLPGTSCELLVDFTLRLLPRENACRLHLPLGLHLPALRPFSANSCPAAVDLSVWPSITAAVSPTHTVTVEQKGDSTWISCQSAAGQDLVLDLPRSVAPCCLLQEDLGTGIGFYRLCTADRTRYQNSPRSQVLLLLDLSGIQPPAKLRAVKELLFRALEALPDGMPVRLMSTAPESQALPCKFVPVGPALRDRIFSALADLPAGQGELSELLCRLPDTLAPDTLCLLFSGGVPPRPDTAVRAGTGAVPVHLFTAGDMAQTDFTRKWLAAGLGQHAHFYAEDKPAERMPRLLEPLFLTGSPVRIVPEDTAVQELFPMPGAAFGQDGYQDVVLRYTGQAPRCFSVWQDSSCQESCFVSAGPAFRKLPFAELLFAYARTEQLSALLGKASPASIRTIKRQLAETGLRYGALNSETMLAVNGENGVSTALPVTLCSGISAGLGEFADRSSIFGEDSGRLSLTPEARSRLLSVCMDVLLSCIRGDGSITAPDAILPAECAEQTAYALLALSLCAGDTHGLARVCDDAADFLAGRRAHSVLGGLVSRRDRLPAVLQDYGTALRQTLPPCSVLVTRLNTRDGDVTAAAQLVLRLFL